MIDKTTSNSDQVILVDEHDRQLGVMDKIEAHRHPAQLHRASSVLLFRQSNGELELLIQQRSKYKIVGALQWANTCCGNLRPGENYEQCAHRRLEEELGITKANLRKIKKFSYQIKCNQEFGEHEIDTVFVGWYDNVVKPNELEVRAVQWIKFERFKISNDLELAPWFRIMIEDSVLVKKIWKWLEENNHET